MILYLVEENVLKEMGLNGNANVREWAATIDDSDLRLSAMTLFEKRLGWERKKKTAPEMAYRQLQQLDLFEEAYKGRIIPIDQNVVAEWAKLLGAKQKHERDMAIAATARVYDLVIVTRNVKDFEGRNVAVLNPFKKPFTISRL